MSGENQGAGAGGGPDDVDNKATSDGDIGRAKGRKIEYVPVGGVSAVGEGWWWDVGGEGVDRYVCGWCCRPRCWVVGPTVQWTVLGSG